MAEKLVLLNTWWSPFAARVRIALAEKGLEYESKEENIFDKSPVLLEMNHVHKKIPVLVHNGMPICESLIILEYIDQVWNHKSPLLPSHPYQRSQARFWADHVDKNMYNIERRIRMEKGEKLEAAKRELVECLKTLEGELGDKAYFAGESIGLVDVALVPFSSWFYTYETLGNFSIEIECPNIVSWSKRCMEKGSVAKSLPDPLKVYDFALEVNKRLGIIEH
ncbi:GST_C domain-containing protein/GST_N_3 domain-containing protein [Cephalotus follicularis]|uniref:glutathione transferase n=1 Tax=Cephalotus follicularis TaxID=3775 RepID=A0A1Q3ASR4_CEPFO|nr:GST_C domain-containing protein/GST_N_3 domain-containing protein [Cephalotus follicularis]